MSKQTIQEVSSGLSSTPQRGGRMTIQLITPGVGSSGVYSEEVLKTAAESKVFSAGTQMFIDHPTPSEEYDRPSRSLKELAGVLLEDAHWDGKGLTAMAKVYSPWSAVLEEMKADIGVSIRGVATVAGEDEFGRPIIGSIVEALSVDFVTAAGRGGAILEVYESARDPRVPLIVRETHPVTPAGLPAAGTTQASEGDDMPQIEESRLTALEEAARRVPELERQLSEAQAAEKAKDTELTKVAEALAAAQSAEDRATAERIIGEAELLFSALEKRGLMAALPLTAEGRLDVPAFTETVTQESAATLAATGAGQVRNLGGGFVSQESDGLSEADFAAAMSSISEGV